MDSQKVKPKTLKLSNDKIKDMRKDFLFSLLITIISRQFHFISYLQKLVFRNKEKTNKIKWVNNLCTREGFLHSPPIIEIVMYDKFAEKKKQKVMLYDFWLIQGLKWEIKLIKQW